MSRNVLGLGVPMELFLGRFLTGQTWRRASLLRATRFRLPRSARKLGYTATRTTPDSPGYRRISHLPAQIRRLRRLFNQRIRCRFPNSATRRKWGDGPGPPTADRQHDPRGAMGIESDADPPDQGDCDATATHSGAPSLPRVNRKR